MKRKIIVLIVAFLTLFVLSATPAQAINYNVNMACSTSNGFQFEQKIVLQTNWSGSHWEIPNTHQGYKNPGWLGLEWRVRLYRNGVTVFDNGYNTNSNVNYVRGSMGAFPKGYNYQLKMNVGRLSDGLATCENNYFF